MASQSGLIHPGLLLRATPGKKGMSVPSRKRSLHEASSDTAEEPAAPTCRAPRPAPPSSARRRAVDGPSRSISSSSRLTAPCPRLDQQLRRAQLALTELPHTSQTARLLRIAIVRRDEVLLAALLARPEGERGAGSA